jgi:hypothetical protein
MGEGAVVELDCVNIQFPILRVDWGSILSLLGLWNETEETNQE